MGNSNFLERLRISRSVSDLFSDKLFLARRVSVNMNSFDCHPNQPVALGNHRRSRYRRSLKNELPNSTKALPIISRKQLRGYKKFDLFLILLVCYRRIEWPVQFGHTKSSSKLTSVLNQRQILVFTRKSTVV